MYSDSIFIKYLLFFYKNQCNLLLSRISMTSIDIFKEEHPSIDSYWRALILFGRNTAAYKFALSKSLLELAQKQNSSVLLSDLAKSFSYQICEHLKLAEKQTTSKDGAFLNACKNFNSGLITQEQLIDYTLKYGFKYVLDAFHVVNNENIPLNFYEKDFKQTSKKLILTDNLFNLTDNAFASNFTDEIEARWRLVETAWELGISRNLLNVKYDNNGKELYVTDTYLRRKDITSARSALNGYQKGKCFYCFKDISITNPLLTCCDVDHFFPHTLKQTLPTVNLDGIWNLVLSCEHCNRGLAGKFSKVPAIKYLKRLHKRNEFLIGSHHPLRETLISQTGKTIQERVIFLKKIDKIAINTLIHRWETKAEAEEIF